MCFRLAKKNYPNTEFWVCCGEIFGRGNGDWGRMMFFSYPEGIKVVKNHKKFPNRPQVVSTVDLDDIQKYY